MRQKYAGTWTALLTPFKADETIDAVALANLVERQIEAGITGVVPAGTTGESPTTTAEEDKFIFETVVAAADGKIKVMAGTGSNNTHHAIEYTENAKAAGADCCMVVTPYYNKPTNEGLKQHFWKVADVGVPLIIYNIKGRTGLNIETDTLLEIAEHEMVVGVKEASGDLAQFKAVLTGRQDDFAVLSGDDALTLELMEMGGDGVVSVASNIVPQAVREMVDSALDDDWFTAGESRASLDDLFKKIFCETNPVPIKYCAYKMGLCELVYRLPMCAPTDASRALLDAMLETYGLLDG